MSGWIECATPGCPGDMRYAAPGRGHIPGCTAPVTASDARPPSDTGTTAQATIAKALAEMDGWEWATLLEFTPYRYLVVRYLARARAVLAALAGQGQP